MPIWHKFVPGRGPKQPFFRSAKNAKKSWKSFYFVSESWKLEKAPQYLNGHQTITIDHFMIFLAVFPRLATGPSLISVVTSYQHNFPTTKKPCNLEYFFTILRFQLQKLMNTGVPGGKRDHFGRFCSCRQYFKNQCRVCYINLCKPTIRSLEKWISPTFSKYTIVSLYPLCRFQDSLNKHTGMLEKKLRGNLRQAIHFTRKHFSAKSNLFCA